MGFKDFLNSGLGVEWKALGRPEPKVDQGKWLMHPAATRRIAWDPTRPEEECKNTILGQWAAAIDDFEKRVKATSLTGSADIRWGILLWRGDLGSFLYYEETMIKPNPARFTAKWIVGKHRGADTKNLGIFDVDTGQKMYSVTLPKNGSKLQPYFHIPTVEDGAYVFNVADKGERPLWVSQETYQALSEEGTDYDQVIKDLLRKKPSNLK
jgi:hypothetical protein